MALKSSPMFAKHEELFDESMDDVARKKMMQKIRNRISAQESRDRRKAQFQTLEDEKLVLKKENDSLKKRVNNLERENQALRIKLQENGIQTDGFSLNRKNTQISQGTASTDDNSVDVESLKSDQVRMNQEIRF